MNSIKQFEIGNQYICKNKKGYDCYYTVIDRKGAIVTFCKKWSKFGTKTTEYKKFKVNTIDFTEKVLIWADKYVKCYIYAKDIINQTKGNINNGY